MSRLIAIIARRRHRVILEEMAAAAAAGADLLEVRLDFLKQPPDLPLLIKARSCPMIATVRRRADGGEFRGSEEERLRLLRFAVAEGVDYVDLEEDIADQIPRYGQTKRIISYHHFGKVPKHIHKLHADMIAKDADVVKLACKAVHATDNFRLLELLQQTDFPTIAVAMGDYGLLSRIVGAKYNAWATYSAYNPRRIVAPGLPTFSECQDLYRYSQINSETKVFAVIGDPIKQTSSPLVHNTAFAANGINAVYVACPVPKLELAEFLEKASQFGICGLSVTIPHKETILQYGKLSDRMTQQCGAANTMVRRDGYWKLYNTDGAAAVYAIKMAAATAPGSDQEPAPEQVEQISLKDKGFLIIGTGGSARATANALLRAEARVMVTGRDPEKVHRFATEVGCVVVDWAERFTLLCDGLINCTPVGMVPNTDETIWPANSFREGMIVFDAVYKPENTRLVREARERGCRVATGVVMFAAQAEEQFRHFTGQKPPAGLMRDLVREEQSVAKNMLREFRLQRLADDSFLNPELDEA